MKSRRTFSNALKRRINSFLANSIGRLLKRHGQIEIFIQPKLPLLTYRSIRKDFGIVLQGPVTNEDTLAFLSETLSQLKECRLLDSVVISTWNESRTFLAELDLDVSVIYSSQDELENNHVKQIVSSRVGIREVSRLGLRYCFKQRVDQRIDPKFGYQFSLDYLNQFHEGRVGFSSLNSFYYRIFGLSDMFNFGLTETLASFWHLDSKIAELNPSSKNLKQIISWMENEVLWSETWLNLSYASRLGFKFTEDSWHDYFKYVQTHTIILEGSSIRHKWLKLNSRFRGSSEKMLFHNNHFQKHIEWSNADYLALLNSKELPNSTFRNSNYFS